ALRAAAPVGAELRHRRCPRRRRQRRAQPRWPRQDPFLPRPVTDDQSSPGRPAGPVRRIHFHQPSFQQPIRRSRIMNRKLVATLAACASLALAAPAGAKDKLLIGSTSASSSQYGYFVALSQLINNKVPNVESSVVET